jgi:hypothetical protein
MFSIDSDFAITYYEGPAPAREDVISFSDQRGGQSPGAWLARERRWPQRVGAMRESYNCQTKARQRRVAAGIGSAATSGAITAAGRHKPRVQGDGG